MLGFNHKCWYLVGILGQRQEHAGTGVAGDAQHAAALVPDVSKNVDHVLMDTNQNSKDSVLV